MASSWGTSWGTSWLDSWGSSIPPMTGTGVLSSGASTMTGAGTVTGVGVFEPTLRSLDLDYEPILHRVL